MLPIGDCAVILLMRALHFENSHGQKTDGGGGGPKCELAEHGRRGAHAGPRCPKHPIGKIRRQQGGGPLK